MKYPALFLFLCFISFQATAQLNRVPVLQVNNPSKAVPTFNEVNNLFFLQLYDTSFNQTGSKLYVYDPKRKASRLLYSTNNPYVRHPSFVPVKQDVYVLHSTFDNLLQQPNLHVLQVRGTKVVWDTTFLDCHAIKAIAGDSKIFFLGGHNGKDAVASFDLHNHTIVSIGTEITGRNAICALKDTLFFYESKTLDLYSIYNFSKPTVLSDSIHIWADEFISHKGAVYFTTDHSNGFYRTTGKKNTITKLQQFTTGQARHGYLLERNDELFIYPMSNGGKGQQALYHLKWPTQVDYVGQMADFVPMPLGKKHLAIGLNDSIAIFNRFTSQKTIISSKGFKDFYHLNAHEKSNSIFWQEYDAQKGEYLHAKYTLGDSAPEHIDPKPLLGGSWAQNPRYEWMNNAGNQLYVGFNGNGVVSLDRLLRDYITVSATCFIDKNENGKRDTGEPSFENLRLQVDDLFLDYLTDENGKFEFPLETGKHTITPIIPKIWKATTKTSYTFNVSSESADLDLAIGLKPTKTVVDVDGFTGGPALRCGFTTRQVVKVINSGTVQGDYHVVLELDSKIKVDSFSQTPDSANGNRFVWVAKNLDPSKSFSSHFYFKVPGISFLGESLDMDATYRVPGKLEKKDTLRGTIRCAFDPNDKSVWPNRETLGNAFYPGEELTYRIRFQNTGNDTAFNVEVTDTLSPHLDWSTFRVLDQSHGNMKATLDSNGMVEFAFPNILLPDSHVNEPRSHGYITFRIKPDSGLAFNTQVHNKADIYFDYNPAITTNQTVSVYADFPVKVEQPNSRSLSVEVFPNPFSNTFSLTWPATDEKANIKVSTADGRLVFAKKNVEKGRDIGIPDLPSGVYLLQVEMGDTYETLRLVRD